MLLNEKKYANNLKDFYSNLGADFVKQLPAAKNKFGKNSVLNKVSNYFKFKTMNKVDVTILLSNVDHKNDAVLMKCWKENAKTMLKY